MTLARLKWAVGILAFLAVAAFLHYSLPQRDIVRIVGTDVVRQDVQREDEQGHEERRRERKASMVDQIISEHRAETKSEGR
jgi:predicted RNase H-like nuclease (RuvC/YqgF family)